MRPAARARTGPVSSVVVVTSERPQPAIVAELTNTNGKWRYAAFHVGLAVSESSTAV